MLRRASSLQPAAPLHLGKTPAVVPAVVAQSPCCSAAKNVILAGVKTVTLHDAEAVQLPDLGAQFYLTEADVGANRAAACQAKLQELNTAVAVAATSEELTDAFLATFDVRL